MVDKFLILPYTHYELKNWVGIFDIADQNPKIQNGVSKMAVDYL